MTTTTCCAECGADGGVSLKACKSCMLVKYCNAECQKNHWPKHKKDCKLRAAELRDAVLFKDPPPKEDCPICFLPMPIRLLSCASLPPATLLSVPIYDFAIANKGVEDEAMQEYFPCCGKSICGGCVYSFRKSGNASKCPFCNSDRTGKTDEEMVGEIMKRVEANDPASMCMLATHYIQQDHAKAMELYVKAADLGYKKAHHNLACFFNEGGNVKKAKFHYEGAAMAGHDGARNNIGLIEDNSGNIERAVKHWIIAASAGNYTSMHNLLVSFNEGAASRESIDSTLAAYNNSCAEMRSKARDDYIQFNLETM